MAIIKTKLANGKTSWGYLFSVGARNAREQYKEQGFKTKDEATKAEAKARLKAAKEARPSAAPKTLAEMIVSFIEDRNAELSPKTIARYKELWLYIDAALLAQPAQKVTALALHREWARLKECGGHTRHDKTPRPLSAKTVRNIAGLVSSAYGWGMLYEVVTVNPARVSKPPKVTDAETRKAVALSPAQQSAVIDAAGGPWCIGPFLEVCAGLGARRGEVLALRWSDLRDGYAHIRQSLGQVGGKLYWKSTKGGKARLVEIPARTAAVLESHRAAQGKYRAHFGSDYRTDLDLIFATPEGDPLRPDSVSSAVSALCKRLKLPRGVSLHALRHSHGSQLIKGGVPIPEVSARLGHANPRTTMQVYAHDIPGSGTAAAVWDRMQEAQPAQGKGKAQ